MRALKVWLHRFVRSHGVMLQRLLPRQDPSAMVTAIARARGINCIIDVGGNVGQYGRNLRMDGFRGQIFSFEPGAEAFRKLERRAAKDARWHVFNYALGAADEELPLNVTADNPMSSFLKPNQLASALVGSGADITGVETVPVKRLDVIFDELVSSIENPRVFLKMDTQGWDFEVLKGAAGCIGRIEGVQSECAIKFTYDGMTPMQDVIDHLAGLGFELSAIFTLTQQNFRIVEADVIMLRPAQ